MHKSPYISWAWFLVLVSTCFAVVNGQVSELWERDIAENPDPKPRDLDSRDYFVAELQSDPRSVAENAGWTLEEPMPIRNHWVFSVPKGKNYRRSVLSPRDVPLTLYDTKRKTLQKRLPVPLPSCEDCSLAKRNEADQEQQLVAEVRSEFSIQDPLFSRQWHVLNAREVGHDMNVIPVWRRNITGAGVTVAVVDDGIDYTHPDMERSFSAEGSWDYNEHRNLPTPELTDDTHGTRCAGEIAADFNDVCGVGLAPGAKVAGIRILSKSLSETDEARALIHRLSVNDIYSCSWGPQDDGKTVEGPAPIVRRAEVAGIEEGRDGKGAIYVVASGNGNHLGDNCNYDGYTNSIFSITIGAIDRENAHPYYSESCSANMVVTYSSNMLDKIVTTDRQHLNVTDNYKPVDDHKCTDQHSGTSAAAPIAAAVFALVLEQRPELTWRDLQYLVRESAQTFDIVQPQAPGIDSIPANVDDWMLTADGHKYHNSYGYGLLNADKIVTMAETWELVGPQAWLIPSRIQTNAPLSDPNAAQDSDGSNAPNHVRRESRVPYEATVNMTITEEQWKEANMKRLEHVKVRVDYQYEKRGALTFLLTSPAGITSELAAPRPRDVTGERVVDWDFMSVVHWGESGVGTWSLTVKGEAPHVGTLYSWQLKLFGEAEDATKARKYSDDWNLYEVPTELVHDALYQSSTVVTSPETTSPIETSPEPTSEATPVQTPAAPSSTEAPQPTESGSSRTSTDGPFTVFRVIVFVLIVGITVFVVWYFFYRDLGNMRDRSKFERIPGDIELEDFEVGDDFVDIDDDDEFNIDSRPASIDERREAPDANANDGSDASDRHSIDSTREPTHE